MVCGWFSIEMHRDNKMITRFLLKKICYMIVCCGIAIQIICSIACQSDSCPLISPYGICITTMSRNDSIFLPDSIKFKRAEDSFFQQVDLKNEYTQERFKFFGVVCLGTLPGKYSIKVSAKNIVIDENVEAIYNNEYSSACKIMKIQYIRVTFPFSI